MSRKIKESRVLGFRHGTLSSRPSLKLLSSRVLGDPHFLVVIDQLIVFNDQDLKKIDRGKETHVLAGVRLLGTVRV